MEKFEKYKLELKGLITGGEWVPTNAGCDDPDMEDTATGIVYYIAPIQNPLDRASGSPT